MASGLWQVNVARLNLRARGAKHTVSCRLLCATVRNADPLYNLVSVMTSLSHILENNARWARERSGSDPDYFARMAKSQAPEILWIGCSDSRVPASLVTGLQPGEVFVHRNIANIVNMSDLSCMSVLQYAIGVLRVKHVIVCGHYGCGGVKAAYENSVEGVIDHWIEPIKQIARDNAEQRQSPSADADWLNHLCEANVCAQVKTLAQTPFVRRAWEAGQDLTLYGWIYALDSGRLRDLNCGRDRATI